MGGHSVHMLYSQVKTKVTVHSGSVVSIRQSVFTGHNKYFLTLVFAFRHPHHPDGGFNLLSSDNINKTRLKDSLFPSAANTQAQCQLRMVNYFTFYKNVSNPFLNQDKIVYCNRILQSQKQISVYGFITSIRFKK